MIRFRSAVILSLFIISIFANTALAFTPQSAEEFLDANAAITVDFSARGILKDLLIKHSNQVFGDILNSTDEDTQKDTLRSKALMDQLIAGERAYISFSFPDTIVIAMRVTDEQWSTLIDGATVETYKDTKVYSIKGGVTNMVRFGEIAVFAETIESLKPLIERVAMGTAGSLSTDAQYKKIVSSYLTNRLIGVSINFSSLAQELSKLGDGSLASGDIDFNVVINNFFKLFTHEGFSVAQTDAGYAFSMKILGNVDELAKSNINLTGEGTFTPRLYTHMPEGNPLLYLEGYNLKGNHSLNNKLYEALFGAQFKEFYDQLYGELEVALGVNIETIANVITKEYGFAIQQQKDSVLPIITFMANVADTRTEAEELVAKLTSTLSKYAATHKDEVKVVSTDGGKRATITLYLQDEAVSHIVDGKLVFTIGVADDGQFVISNLPDVLKSSSRTGFGPNTDLLLNKGLTANAVQGVFYLNARSVWKWIDGIHRQAIKSNSKNFLSLNSIREYYSFVDTAYPFKDMLITEESTASDSTIRGWLTIDTQKHTSFKDFISGLQATDQDGDDISDFEELYLYKTSPSDRDCNDDGIYDIDAMKAGYDPCNATKPAFKDFDGRYLRAESQTKMPYYYGAVANLKHSGVINGYPDGSFGAGKTVTRAEFVQMVMKAFQSTTPHYFGGDASFTDVGENQWYFDAVEKAYSLGFISGNVDSKGRRMFRPADPITRAEALTILNQASNYLSMELGKTRDSDGTCSAPFKDVPSSAWFCFSVSNAKRLQITAGRDASHFAPQDKLTRAEGAVLIYKALQLDINNPTIDKPTSSSFSNFIDSL